MTPRSPERLRFGDPAALAPWLFFVGLYIVSIVAILFWGDVTVFHPAFIIAIPILIALSVIDYQSYRIPDYCTFSLGVIAFGVAFYDENLILHTSSAITLGVLLWLASEWYFRTYERDALGMGDIKLIMAVTIWVGPENLAILLFFASSAGIILVLLERLKTSRSTSEASLSQPPQLAVPFGPFLAYSFFLTIVTSTV